MSFDECDSLYGSENGTWTSSDGSYAIDNLYIGSVSESYTISTYTDYGTYSWNGAVIVQNEGTDLESGNSSSGLTFSSPSETSTEVEGDPPSTEGAGVFEGGVYGFPENGADGGLLFDIEADQLEGIDGADFEAFLDFFTGFGKVPPQLALPVAYGAVPLLGGPAPSLGLAPFGIDFPYQETLGFEPGTNSSTPNGLPGQEAAALLGNLADNPVAPDGVSRDAPPSPTATLVTLAAAGRNPADITLPTQGSEAVDPPPGSHEVASSQSWTDWIASKAKSAASYVSQTASSVASTVSNEISLLPGTAANLPAAIGSTAMSGEMADSFAGAVDGGVNATAGAVGVRPLAGGPIYGNEQAFANGRVVGQGAVLAGETAVFVYGTMGLGALALPAAGAGAAAGAGGAVLTAEVAGTAVAGNVVIAGFGLYMAASTAGNMASQGGGGPNTPATGQPPKGGNPLQSQIDAGKMIDPSDKSGILTKAGRALEKHGNRPGTHSRRRLVMQLPRTRRARRFWRVS